MNSLPQSGEVVTALLIIRSMQGTILAASAAAARTDSLLAMSIVSTCRRSGSARQSSASASDGRRTVAMTVSPRSRQRRTRL